MSWIGSGSIGLGLLVLTLKAAAWWLTGSAAFYSDALESVVNVAAAGMALFALRYAALPADANHLYGHGKVEFFAAVVEGVLIVVAALSILQHAWATWQAPRMLHAPAEGILLNGLATVLNAGWATLLLRVGREIRSPALQADARHLFTDVATSSGIILAICLVVWTGRAVLDPMLAVAVSVYVLWSGMHLIGASVGGLMDAAPPEGTIERIRTLIRENAVGALEAHDLRTRHAGRQTFIDFHLVVPSGMPVATAHAICDRIEAALKAEMGDPLISIHVEPEEKAKGHGVIVL